VNAAIAELIEHLSRHEGGALGRAEVVLVTPSEDVRLGASVDRVIAKLRGLAATREPGDTRTVGITTQAGQLIELRRVLGYDTVTGCVAIEAAEPRDDVLRARTPTETEETQR
jgi:hypothetical protein